MSNLRTPAYLAGSFSGCGVYPDADNNIITSNKIFGSHLYEGVYVCGNNNEIISNTINNSDESGVDLDASCNSPGLSGLYNTVSQNKITEACAGLLLNPNTSGPTLSLNSFYSTAHTQISGVIGANACDFSGSAPATIKGGLSDVP